MFAAMKYEGGVLALVDQRLLPAEEIWLQCKDLETVAKGIEDMVIRGAPAIGCCAAYGLAIDSRSFEGKDWGSYRDTFTASVERLARTRPTAVNLFYALNRMKDLSRDFRDSDSMAEVANRIEMTAHELYDDDLATCKAIGRHGAAYAIELFGKKKLRILTHCNTGSLATAGYGTALGVIRSLHEQGFVEVVYADETRPYLQGSRLTAFELKSEGMPYKVIADSAAAYLMQQGKIDMVVVGADRIAANGDTANKIGTYSVAVNAKHHGVAFFVAAPLSTFDAKIPDGSAIPVEERTPEEIRVTGGRQMTPPDAPVYNPSFDVTPSTLITGIVTERGVLKAPYKDSIKGLAR